MALTSKLSAIGDAIRAKAGTTDKLTLSAMPDAIANIPSGGGGGDVDALVDRSIAKYSSDTITAIGAYSFYGCRLLSFNAPKCQSIGEHALANNLFSEIDLPVCTDIAEYAFTNCTGLTTLNAPKCTTIGQNAFNGTGLSKVELPCCETVGECAFQAISELEVVSLPQCKTVGKGAFCSNKKLTQVSLPECTTIDGESYSTGAFLNCTNLVTIDLPKCTTLGGGAFENCTSLANVSAPSVQTLQGGPIFAGCQLTTFTFEQAITCSSDYMAIFNGCRALKQVTFKQGVNAITYNCFFDCSTLTSVVIESTAEVTLFSTRAFSGCFHIEGEQDDEYNPDGLKDGYIYVPDTLVDSYKTATNWSTFASQIKPLSELPTT